MSAGAAFCASLRKMSLDRDGLGYTTSSIFTNPWTLSHHPEFGTIPGLSIPCPATRFLPVPFSCRLTEREKRL